MSNDAQIALIALGHAIVSLFALWLMNRQQTRTVVERVKTEVVPVVVEKVKEEVVPAVVAKMNGHANGGP